MRLTDEERLSLAQVRAERAYKTFEEARGIAEAEFWNAAANRLYYACYYMTTAVLVKHGFEASTHAGVIRLFGLHFVSTGLVAPELGKFYSKLFELRQTGDYADWVYLSADDILPLIPTAQIYLDTLKELV